MNKSSIGGWASLFAAAIAVANLVVVFGVLGVAVAGDPTQIATLVMTRPAPLLWLELFKLLAAAANWVVVQTLARRLSTSPSLVRKLATGCGMLAALLLFLAGLLGCIAILQGGYGVAMGLLPTGATYRGINTVVNRFGLSSLLVNGLWLLGICWVASQTKHLPPRLRYLGLVLGVSSVGAFFLPPLALLVLLLGFIWSVWLGWFLLADISC